MGKVRISAECPECHKVMRKDTLKRHMKVHQKKDKPNPKSKKKTIKRPNRKSTNFFLTFQKPWKYDIVKKLHALDNQWVKGLTIGNEWGCGYPPNGHCHALLSVGAPGYSHEDMKKILKEEYRLIPNDIQTAKSVKDSVSYISKEDYRCVSKGHDKDYLSIICKAYLYASKYDTFKHSSYPYCKLGRAQQAQFKEYLTEFMTDNEFDYINAQMDQLELRPWQEKAVKILLNQKDRKVLWLYDEIGGHGKTTLAKYLSIRHGALILNNGATADIALTYNKEKIVIFDYTRTEEKINYKAIEHLKNGIMFSPKYNSHMKFFPPPKVLCLSNNLPDLMGLSKDRWHILEFNSEAKLRRYNLN